MFLTYKYGISLLGINKGRCKASHQPIHHCNLWESKLVLGAAQEGLAYEYLAFYLALPYIGTISHFC